MINLRDKVIDVSCGKGSCNSTLVIGEEKVALIDCGMPYCAKELFENIKRVLGEEKTLDYILISHSHYDHIGAIPYLRQIWTNVKVLGAKHAQYVLKRENALKTIRELSNQAAQYYDVEETVDYDDNLMKVDIVISEEDKIDLGGIDIKVLETPGHTKCCLSFLIGDEILFASETTGVLMLSGDIYPVFIISYQQTINSIEKCQRTQHKYIISPHHGFLDESDPKNYWKNCISAVRKSANFILERFAKGYSEDKIFEEYKDVYFNDVVKLHQPESAFDVNTKAMIKGVLI
ncbi:glyoxylase-like metal-dependent hydrolase (beta-lactamase superfamily II) [Alkalibaculum bacchi]|uniref:Glyoxylase-like metal-dependent hydrolase (Beta-lactamase superfamily II) n=1 Tax=Alkalibaculum bacchi TaxID=645887 RepID=A0A366HXF5_9FIRM|nr:MBL fold metallo-hydrolase [Alkalibaculum bacchi]RBP57954.1 glyoxylase-like metal-dependent hydrolase (beta-lactamase superfamily II) [Alkalibaculum bacchi]